MKANQQSKALEGIKKEQLKRRYCNARARLALNLVERLGR